MKEKIKRYSLLFIAAAVISASLPSCSKAEDPKPSDNMAEAEQAETTVTTTAATAAAEEKTKAASAAAKKEKAKTTTAAAKSGKDTKKKKKTTTTLAKEEPAAPDLDESAIENYVDKNSGFFSERAVSLLGLDKDDVLKKLSYDENYMVDKESDDKGIERLEYVVDRELKQAFTLEFTDKKLTSFECSSNFDDFNTALSLAKTKGWIPDDSKTIKGKRVFIVPGKKAVYTIFKTRDDEDGTAFITQSYSVK